MLGQHGEWLGRTYHDRKSKEVGPFAKDLPVALTVHAVYAIYPWDAACRAKVIAEYVEVSGVRNKVGIGSCAVIHNQASYQDAAVQPCMQNDQKKIDA